MDLGGSEQFTINGATLLVSCVDMVSLTVCTRYYSWGGGRIYNRDPSRVWFRGARRLNRQCAVNNLIIGGQEFWIDNVCVVSNSTSPAVGPCRGCRVCNVYCEMWFVIMGVDNGSQALW